MSWLLLLLHALVLVLSVMLLLSPNALFNRHNGLATVKLNINALLQSSPIGSNSASNLTAIHP